MSINVNVNANPISIHRGRMVTAALIDPEHEKKEFEKRRKIRLEQVRQQSKEIAESVRNKVRNEKNKQLSDYEKQGEKQLKMWQAKKLLALQEQYQESLKDIGLGHMQAIVEEESDYAEEIRKDDLAKIAQHRGKEAVHKLHENRKKIDSEKEKLNERKKLNQAVENARSSLVVNINKNVGNRPPREKVHKHKNVNLATRSDTENEFPTLFTLIDSPSNFTSGSCSPDCIRKKDPKSRDTSPYGDSKKSLTRKVNREQSSDRNVNSSIIDIQSLRSAHIPLEKRISERIRSRTEVREGDACDTCSRSNLLVSPDDSNKLQSQIAKENISKKPVHKAHHENELKNRPCETLHKELSVPSTEQSQLNEIPKKSTITLRSVRNKHQTADPTTLISASLSGKTKYYDHKNRYSKETHFDGVTVEKIDKDSIEVLPGSGSEVEFTQKMYKRDREAEIRGQEALKKVKAQKDYQKIVKNLPHLQKHEKIASIPHNNPKFHMSEDRLKQCEKKKQLRMEDAYEKYFPKQIVTIPPKRAQPSQVTELNSASGPIINCTWDFDSNLPHKKATASKRQHTSVSETKKSSHEPSTSQSTSKKPATENLQGMLKSLTRSRDKLVKELASLPEDSELHKFLSKSGGLDSIDQIIKTGKTVEKEPLCTKRKRMRSKPYESRNAETNTSPEGRQNQEDISSPERIRKISKYHLQCVSPTSCESPPTRIIKESIVKSKSPSPVRSVSPKRSKSPNCKSAQIPSQQTALKTISTQTTPAQNEQTVVSKVVQSCNCKVSPATSDNACEIVIRIDQCGKSKICVAPTETEYKSPQISSKQKDHEHQKSPKKKDNEQYAVEETLVREVKSPLPKAPCLQEKHFKETVFKDVTPKKKSPKKYVQLKSPKWWRENTKKGKLKRNDLHQTKDLKVVKTEDKYKADNCSKKKQVGASVTSWREYLMQNSTTSSTSYYSPPDLTSKPTNMADYNNFKVVHRVQQNPDCTSRKMQEELSGIPDNHYTRYHSSSTNKQNLQYMLRDRPQQNNLTCSTPNILTSLNPSILCYIEKLLTMSRKNIDDLTVSSVSDVSTPSSSVININTNINVQQIRDALRSVNLDMSSINQFLSYSADESNFNNDDTNNTITQSSQSAEEATKCKSTCLNLGNNRLDARKLNFDDYSSENYSKILDTYNEMANNYSKRIENLANMIEKIRLEKAAILQDSAALSDRGNNSSSKYFDLPIEKNKEFSIELNSPNSSAEQEKLNKKLLEIDVNFTERLKKMSIEEARKEFGARSENFSEEQMEINSVDEDILQRYNQLLGKNRKKTQETNIALETLKCACPTFLDNTKECDKSNEFVPLLLDIPRLPKLVSNVESDCDCKHKTKPPVSKGITAVNRIINEDTIIPHELSTIVEAETSKINVKSPDYNDKRITPKSTVSSPSKKTKSTKSVEIKIPLSDELKNEDAIESSILNTPKLKICSPCLLTSPTSALESDNSSKQLPGFLHSETLITPEIVSKTTFESDTSTSELEAMESMLKSLGMSWAVSTIRKTQEALNAPSSSSSLEFNSKEKLNSNSEISLKEFITNSSVNTSSSLKSTDFPNATSTSNTTSPYDASNVSQEKTAHRTSTPLQSINKSSDKINVSQEPPPVLLVSGESDLSSIKAGNQSDHDQINPPHDQFYSLNESSTLTTRNSNA